MLHNPPHRPPPVGAPGMKCSICGKRTALYYREYSGHRLCLPCLERILVRRARRTLRSLVRLREDSRLLAPVFLTTPAHSLATALLVAKAEEGFESTLIVAVPEPLRGVDALERLAQLSPVTVETMEVDVGVPEGAETAIHCWRFDRAWSLWLAKRLEVDAVLYPLTRTLANIHGLEALVLGDPHVLGDSLPRLGTEPPLVSPVYDIEAQALSAYAYLRGVYVGHICNAGLHAKKLYYSIARGRPELEFSSTKTLGVLASSYEPAMRCALCGGYSPSRICPYCSALLGFLPHSLAGE